MRNALSAIFALIVLSMLPAAVCGASIPPVPAGFEFTSDFAGVLDASAIDQLAALQAEAFNAHQTPLIVVTIPSMATYGHRGEIERLAAEWFNVWGIGSPQRNTGILILVSIGDRKARIELGGAWGRRGDQRANAIMRKSMIPRFKEGNYAAGIVAAARELAALAADGPDALPQQGAQPLPVTTPHPIAPPQSYPLPQGNFINHGLPVQFHKPSLSMVSAVLPFIPLAIVFLLICGMVRRIIAGFTDGYSGSETRPVWTDAGNNPPDVEQPSYPLGGGGRIRRSSRIGRSIHSGGGGFFSGGGSFDGGGFSSSGGFGGGSSDSPSGGGFSGGSSGGGGASGSW